MQPSARKAQLKRNTYDPASRTFEAIAASETPVKMGSVREILLCNESAIDLSRMPLPILADHKSYSLENQLGNWIEARFESGQLILTGKLGVSETASRIAAELESGHSFGVSVGYQITEFTESDNRETRTVSKWSIHEASLTPIGADPKAKTRSQNTTPANNQEEEGGNPMPQPVDQTTTPKPSTRAADVTAIANKAGLDSAWIAAQIDSESTIDQVRAAAFEQMESRTPVISNVRSHEQSPADQMRGMREALQARTTGERPSDAAMPYASYRMVDFARDALKRANVSTLGLSVADTIERAMHTTSDFPLLLQGEGRRELANSYQLAQSAIKTIAKKSTAQDFREKQKIGVSDYGGMQKLSESGEIQSVSRTEVKSSYRLETFAAMTSISLRALINDDLNAFSDWAAQAGRMAAEMEAAQLVALLESNPKIEGKTLFHTSRGNLEEDAAYYPVTSELLSKARYAMRMQKGLDGKTPIAATPKYLLVHPDRETQAEKVLEQIHSVNTEDVNVFAGKLQILVEPRLSRKYPWYVFADPAQLPVFEYSFLTGEEGPQVATQAMFNQLGMSFRVHEHFGAGAIDWRGAYMDVSGGEEES